MLLQGEYPHLVEGLINQYKCLNCGHYLQLVSLGYNYPDMIICDQKECSYMKVL